MSWRSAALGDLCDIEIGKTPSRAEPAYWRDGTLPWLSIADMNQGRDLRLTKECVTEHGAQAARMRLVKPGTLLLSYKLSIGKVGFARVPMYTNEAIAALSNLSSDVDPGFMYWALQHVDLLQGADRAAMGATLNKAKLTEIRFPVPPLAEQRRIAAILDKADALRAKRREAIAKLDQLLQSVFLDMFGDPVANPKNWPKVALSELFDIARGGSPRPIDDYITDAANGVNWIMIGDTVAGSKYIIGTKKKIKPEGVRRSREVKPGDFLLTNSMSFGRPYILRTAGCIHDGWLVLSPRSARTNADYLFSVLASPSLYGEFARRAPGATVKNLNIDLVSGVEIPVPDSALQAEFSRRIAAIEAAQNSQQTALGGAEQLFLSVQAKAFSVGL